MNVLTKLIKESEAYQAHELVEQMIEGDGPLTAIPMEPLYLAIKNLNSEMASALLPRLSYEQRQAFLYLDLWHKDQVVPHDFEFWLSAYAYSPDDYIRMEFTKTNQLAIYLKSVFNIWTFDVEEPEYPEHDNYFLTDDSLLLFEFKEDYPYVHEVKTLVRELYGEMGVENAYAFLFKMVADDFSNFEEDEYRRKKDFLRDYGFVDYFDALELTTPFPTKEHLKRYIENRSQLTPQILEESKNQTLNAKALSPFKQIRSVLVSELEKISDRKREEYLHFNFIRLMNSHLSISGGLKEGSVAMVSSAKEARELIELGFEYVSQYLTTESLFSTCDFTMLYKVGKTLIATTMGRLKKALRATSFEESNGFVGRKLGEFIDESFMIPPVIMSEGQKNATPITTLVQLNLWEERIVQLELLLPFIERFYQSFAMLKEEGRLQDSFYLNYTVDAIDFEAIILSALANELLGNYMNSETSLKMGLTLDEYKEFSALILKDGKILSFSELSQPLLRFANNYGLSKVPAIDRFLYDLLSEQMEDYDFHHLSLQDFRHVGGPIILDSTSKS